MSEDGKMDARPLIVVVEDEEHLATGLVFNLEAEGYRTRREGDGGAALAWLLRTPEAPAAVLLDVMLPGRDGFEIVRELRAAGRFFPVLMLTARGRTEDVLEGLTAGADDYLPKPFDLDVLLARLHVLLRRMQWQGRPEDAVRPAQPTAEEDDGPAHTPPPQVRVGERVVDFETLEIRGGERTVRLTLMEADLLRYVLERPGKIVARKELLENVWRVHEDTDTRAIDNFVVRLRRYLESDPAHPTCLLTVRGVGYRYIPPGAEA